MEAGPCPQDPTPGNGVRVGKLGGAAVTPPRGQQSPHREASLALLRPPSQEKAVPSVLGHQIGLLMLLWHDVDEVTHSLSCQSVCLLLQLLTQQKGELCAGGGPHSFLGSGPGPWAPLGLTVVWSGGCHFPGFTGHLTECPTTGNKAEFVYLNKMKSFEARSCRESEMKFYHLVKVGL